MIGDTLTSEVPPSPCPYCEVVYTLTTSFGGRAVPTPGAWSVCWSCAQFLVYDNDLTTRKPLPEELDRMSQQNPRMRRLLDETAAFVRQQRR